MGNEIKDFRASEEDREMVAHAIELFSTLLLCNQMDVLTFNGEEYMRLKDIAKYRDAFIETALYMPIDYKSSDSFFDSEPKN